MYLSSMIPKHGKTLIFLAIISLFVLVCLNCFAQAPHKYTYTSDFINGYAAVKYNGNAGVVDKNNKVIVPLIYDDIRLFFDGCGTALRNGKYGYLNIASNREIIPCKYDDLYALNGNHALIVVMEKGWYGLFDKAGRKILPCDYDRISCGFNSILKVTRNNKISYLNRNGTVMIPTFYDAGSDFVAPGIAQAKFKDKWGWIDKTGKTIVPFVYDEMIGMVSVAINDKWGTLDEHGKLKIKCMYDKRLDFYSSDYRQIPQSYIELKGKWGLIDYNGKIIIPAKYDDHVGPPPNTAMLNGKYGLLDKNGKEVTPFIYDKMNIEGDGIYVVLNGKWGTINSRGKTVIPCIYSKIYGLPDSTANNIIAVYKDHKAGVLNTSGIQVIPIIYDSIGYYSEGKYEVKLHGKWGYLDKNGNKVIDFKYDKTHSFSSGLASVQKNGKWGFINKSGKLVIAFKYDSTSNFGANAYVKLGKKWGGIDKGGKVVIPFIYASFDEIWQKFNTDDED